MIEFKEAHTILKKIYIDKAFCDIELKKAHFKGKRDLIYRIVYGTIEKDYSISKDLFMYLDKSKELPTETLIALKIGMYVIKYINSIPDHAIVDAAVSFFNTKKDSWQKGIVNAILRGYIRKEKEYIPQTRVEKLAYENSCPLWYLNKLIAQIGEEKAIKIFSSKEIGEEQIRVNTRLYSNKEFEDFLKTNNIKYRRGIANEFIVLNNDLFKDLFRKGKITYQSGSSMLCVDSLDLKDNQRFLDLCAAPGGKSVYASEKAKNLDILACDIHEHRIELIKKYTERMNVNNIKTLCTNSSEYNDDFRKAFDRVLVDAPCSGLGITNKKADILLRVNSEKIKSLKLEQIKILQNGLKYLDKDGVLVYSTCSILKEENEDVVNFVLLGTSAFRLEKINIDIENNGMITLYPDENIKDGFFIAKIRRIF